MQCFFIAKNTGFNRGADVFKAIVTKPGAKIITAHTSGREKKVDNNIVKFFYCFDGGVCGHC